MTIAFSVDYKTWYGQNVFIKGSLDELGGGDESRAVMMQCSPDSRWSVTVDVNTRQDTVLTYSYFVKDQDGLVIREAGQPRRVRLSHQLRFLDLEDSWQGNGETAPLLSAPFTDVIFSRQAPGFLATHVHAREVIIRATLPAMQPSDRLFVCGNIPLLGDWDESKAVEMTPVDSFRWAVSLPAAKLGQDPVLYKFLLQTGRGTEWEEAENHVLGLSQTGNSETFAVEHCDIRFKTLRPRFVGTAVPVFSLRSRQDCGIGDFGGLKLMIDWAAAAGQQFIQLLPLNDTCATRTWRDANPYGAISVMALNPVYIDLARLAPLRDKALSDRFSKVFADIRELPELDYEKVFKRKEDYCRKVYDEGDSAVLDTPAYRQFAEDNADWLPAYSAFCALRDEYGTGDFSKWGDFAAYDPSLPGKLRKDGKMRDAMDFCCYMQYQLHLQLSEIHGYATSRGVALKGDVPAGISPFSVEAWTSPEFFNMESRAGAPPDSFSRKGQNWDFPTYNWDGMARDGFSWWKRRMRKMAAYFDACRLDHALGFFRIWEIPSTQSYGTLGHYSPALAYHPDELRANGFDFNYERDARPFIRYYQIKQIFGDRCEFVQRHFLDSNQIDVFTLKEKFDTQKKIAAWFKGRGQKFLFRFDGQEVGAMYEGLMSLVSEVLFVEDPGTPGRFHPCINAQDTWSFAALPDDQKAAFMRIHDDYYSRRNEACWKEQAYRILPEIAASTNMLVCAEDLGMAPMCARQVLGEMKLPSLEVQRLPKNSGWMWGDPRQYPYLSVCTPSTHDSSTIRGWWEENREYSARYYHDFLGFSGDVPVYCESWLAERIIRAHLTSSSMLAVIPIQDWLATAVSTRRPGKPAEERISNPSEPERSWRYRMHIPLEDLLAKKYFNIHIRQIVSGTR